MRNRKISFWYKQGLVAVLLVACAVASVGVSWARYQTNVQKNAKYEVREQAAVFLWSVTEDGELSAEPGSWVTEGDSKSLSFAVSNGDAVSTYSTDYSAESQGVRIRLLASLGLSYTEDVKVELLLPCTGGAEDEPVEAVAKQILSGSPYYTSFGGGWVFEFEDEYGEEMYWLLEGGELSTIMGQIRISGLNMSDNALLQLQVESDVSKG